MASCFGSSSRTFEDDDTDDLSGDDTYGPTPLESFWLFILGDDEDQKQGRQDRRGRCRDDTATADKRDKADASNPIAEVRSPDLSENPELVRNFSFWRRKKEQQQEEQLQRTEAALASERPALGEEETEQRDVKEEWSWEFDKEAFSLSSGGSSERESSNLSNPNTTTDARFFDDRRTGGRWLEGLQGRGKNKILTRNFHERRMALEGVNAADGAQDEHKVANASTWHFELDTDALGFGGSTSIDEDDDGNDAGAEPVGGWGLFGGGRVPAEKEKPKGTFLATVPLVKRLSTRK